MEDRKPLFDRPMDELREEFVRARFGQEDVFGMEDIEAWLAKQREAERPTEKTWARFLGRGSVQPWADRDFFDLRSHATLLGLLNEQFGSLGMANEYGPIYDRLAFVPGGLKSTRGLYSGDAGMLYVEDHIYGPMFVVREKSGEVTIHRVERRSQNPGARAILGVVFAEWLHGRPKWKEARHSLCTALASEINDERAKAEADFDTAVAVSADGTKIVHADWVVVGEHGQHNRILLLRVYPGSSFRDRKIRCAEDRRSSRLMVGSHENYDLAKTYNWSLAKQVGWMVRRTPTIYPLPYEQEYAVTRSLYAETVGKLPQASILITGGYYCPSPLPEGGVEVTV